MTPKQQRFVAEYLIDLNATQAAIRCGYSAKTARQQASELLTKPDIEAAVSAGKAKQLQHTDLTAARVLEELRRIGFANRKALFDATGNLKPITELTDEEAAQIKSFEVIIKNAQAGDGHTDRVHKIQTEDKPKSLEMLAKLFGLLKETVDVQGGLTIAWENE